MHFGSLALTCPEISLGKGEGLIISQHTCMEKCGIMHNFVQDSNREKELSLNRLNFDVSKQNSGGIQVCWLLKRSTDVSSNTDIRGDSFKAKPLGCCSKQCNPTRQKIPGRPAVAASTNPNNSHVLPFPAEAWVRSP